MYNFDFHLQTRWHFGKGAVDGIGEEILNHGKHVFFMYDEIPAEATGAYDLIHGICDDKGIKITDFVITDPHPKHTVVDEAAEEFNKNGCDLIVCLGGGATIDTAKSVSFAVHTEGSCWDVYENKPDLKKFAPLITVPSIAASGSEVSNVAVMGHTETGRKLDYRNNLMRPVAVFADPTYTFTVPKFQTAFGIVDIMTHAYEGYFSASAGAIQDGFSETMQKACIENGRKVMQCPNDYDARAELLWAAELAISHLSDQGRNFVGNIHSTERVLAEFFGFPHGAGVAIVSLGWFKYSLTDKTAPRYARWGKNVWGLDGNQDDMTIAKQAIQKYEDFLGELNLPTRLCESRMEVTEETVVEACHKLMPTVDPTTWFRPLSSEAEMMDFLRLCWK